MVPVYVGGATGLLCVMGVVARECGGSPGAGARLCPPLSAPAPVRAHPFLFPLKCVRRLGRCVRAFSHTAFV